jgi:hypothetical protein
LLHQIETLDLRAIMPNLFHISSEAGQSLIDLHATNPGAAIQRGIKNLDRGHNESPVD